jgi:hypothetical protein
MEEVERGIESGRAGGLGQETTRIQNPAGPALANARRHSFLDEVFSYSFTDGSHEEVAGRVASMVSAIEVTGVASAALVIYVGLKAGVSNARLAKSMSYSAGRITQLGRYGAYVYRLHKKFNTPLDTIPTEKSIREYLEDAATLSGTLDDLADVATQLMLDKHRIYEDAATGELKDIIEAHPRRQVAENFTRVKSALGTLRNTCNRLQATSEVVGNWQAWKAKADKEDVESLIRMLRWLPAECGKIADELEG